MAAAMEAERLGSCTNYSECGAVCPKEIRLDVIGCMIHDWMRAVFLCRREARIR